MKKINKTVLAFLSVFVLSFIGTTTLFAASPTTVNLGSAGNFSILAKTGVSTTGPTSVVGNVGVSPAAATFITGFGLILPAASDFGTSSLVSGKVYASDYANPTPANLTTAVLDMQTAYTDAQGRAAGVTELGAGNIGGLTLAPGVYKWGTGVTIPTDVTISGSATDIWIFQIAQNLDISSATKIVLSGGAHASNIFWVVAGQTTIGTTAVFNGNILDQTAIVINTGATLNGKALAQTAVTLDSNTITSSSIYEFPIVTIIPPIASPVSGNYVNINTSSPISTPISIIISNANTKLEEGCLAGNKYNIMNGHICDNNTVIEVGCNNGNLFSTVSGHACVYTAPEIGCTVGNKFSTVNGLACSNMINPVTKYDLGVNTLSLGSNGVEVSNLQNFLNKYFNINLESDGVFGSNTNDAVIKYQKGNNLIADGFVGIKTIAKINGIAQ